MIIEQRPIPISPHRLKTMEPGRMSTMTVMVETTTRGQNL